MLLKLSDDLRQAIRDQAGGPVTVEDEQSQTVYVLVDSRMHEEAMQALREREDLAAIRSGIDDMEAGHVVPFEEVDARIRSSLGMPQRT